MSKPEFVRRDNRLTTAPSQGVPRPLTRSLKMFNWIQFNSPEVGPGPSQTPAEKPKPCRGDVEGLNKIWRPLLRAEKEDKKEEKKIVIEEKKARECVCHTAQCSC